MCKTKRIYGDVEVNVPRKHLDDIKMNTLYVLMQKILLSNRVTVFVSEYTVIQSVKIGSKLGINFVSELT